MSLSAAIDLSTPDIAFAVADTDTGRLVFSESAPMAGRDASRLAPWMISTLKKHGADIREIRKWTCGAGPGSFTGLRIAASLVSGMTFRKPETVARCVPSGLAIARSTGGDVNKSMVLYDGRRNELIGYVPSLDSLVVIGHSSNPALDSFECFASMESHLPAIKTVLGNGFADKVFALKDFPIGNLIVENSIPWPSAVHGECAFKPDMLYLRPPV